LFVKAILSSGSLFTLTLTLNVLRKVTLAIASFKVAIVSIVVKVKLLIMLLSAMLLYV
jgi:hypothetical protein